MANTLSKPPVAMDSSSVSRASVLGFGVFELDCQAGELRKSGVLVHLPPQPCRILSLLASRPGRVVTRKDIRWQIWGDETFVDFEHGLNHCITQIRTALGDDAETPRYIETLPRRGYRFIAPVETVTSHAEAVRGPLRYKRWVVGLGIGAAALLALSLTFNVAGLRNRLLGHATGPPIIHSIAVLPLENLSRDPDQEYFAEGMTEELITTLGQVSALRVISHTSVMRYKGTQKPLPEIARELNVDAIVEGTVERSGNRVRITANLLYAPADRHLWAQTYERNLGDVLSLQDDVARDIASQIDIKLTLKEHARLSGSRPVNPEAYRLYLQGRYYFFKRTPSAFDKSIQLLRQAVEEDPNSARAYAGLSESYGILPLYDLGQPKVAFPKAKTAALKALELDGTLAEAHAALGNVLFFYDWDWPAAERELKRAIELKPGYVVAHHWYAQYLTAMGRHEEAFAEIRRAEELDPASPLLFAIGGEVCNYARLYDRAIKQCRKGLDLDSNFGLAHEHLGWAYLEKGMYREAMAEYDAADRLLERADRLGPARVLAASGRRGEALRMLNRLNEQAKHREISRAWVAALYADLGKKQGELDFLQEAYEYRDPYMVYLNVNSGMDPLRSDPRFQDILHRMNFPK